MTKKTNLFMRAGRTGILFIVIVVLYIVYKTYISHYITMAPELIEHLMLLLSAMVGVHLLERVLLWKEIADWNRDSLEHILKSSLKLVRAGNECGLKMVYPKRENVREDVHNELKNAKKRIWLLGIAFSEEINLSTILEDARRKIGNGFDFKILLLDVLRSPAVFRSFLESPPNHVENMLDVDRSTPPDIEPYVHQRMYADFKTAYTLIESFPEYAKYFRFYAHNPNSWMVLVDDVVYYQPYMFGRGHVKAEEKLCIGSLMPIFKFNKEKNVNTFNIIEDHFRKLWLTSDMDSFHIRARVADEKRIIHDIFTRRYDWLKHVYGAIYINKCNDEFAIDDHRLFPRRSCELKLPVNLNISPINRDKSFDVMSTIENISQEGLCLQIKSDDMPAKGDKIELNLDLSKLSISTRVSMDYLMNSCNNIFKVVWTNKKRDVGMSLIGLHASN